jgi:hypothetical protein
MPVTIDDPTILDEIGQALKGMGRGQRTAGRLKLKSNDLLGPLGASSRQ